ncbi:hypothetical protein WT01_02950 [Burkholderia cepacia]|nr:hypothetical protein WS88_10610 [Burkholderia cepacia]KVL44829.1 hypothetical protein WT01_02950 [Burkholderia cepacia]
MGLFGSKLSSLGSGLKDSLAEAKNTVAAKAERMEVPAALSDLTDKATSRAAGLYASGKGHVARLTDLAGEKLGDIDYDALKRSETYVAKFREYKDLGLEKVGSYYRSTFEVDKTTSEMISDLRGRLPARPKDVDDIFERIRREAFQRAISAFCLGPIMQGLDNKLEGRYANLSVSYSDYKKQTTLDAHENYAKFEDVRKDALPLQPVENGYNSGAVLYPADAQIDHIISKKEYYEDFLIRLATNDDEFVNVINAEDNLTFANGSFNGGKGSKDLMEYIEKNGRPDELDPNIIHFKYDKGGDVTINKAEALEKYERAQERMRQARIDAAKEIGLTVASASARMAAQQVVGLIVVETIDIFVDEIKDIAVNGKFFDENGLLANINQRRQNISDRLTQRFEERQIWARARAAGIEGGVAGALAAIPQILISLIVKMPAFMLSIIRECTLSVVRSVRVLISDDENKFDGIKVVMLGTASAVMGVYVANVISKAIAPVPMLNVFNRQVTEVLSGVVVTAVPLSAVYVFDKYKTKFIFAALGSGKAV